MSKERFFESVISARTASGEIAEVKITIPASGEQWDLMKRELDTLGQTHPSLLVRIRVETDGNEIEIVFDFTDMTYNALIIMWEIFSQFNDPLILRKAKIIRDENFGDVPDSGHFAQWRDLTKPQSVSK